MNRNNPILYIVIPCYNEEQVLPYTNPMFVEKIEQLVKKEEIHPLSKIMYVNDGSKDRTWELIESYANSIPSVVGVSQSRNRGHQSSVLAGMYEAIQFADIVITTDADGQDDINCMDKMISEYKSGSEIVYGVRDNRVIRTLLLNELQPKVFIKCYAYLEQKLFLIMLIIAWFLKDS